MKKFALVSSILVAVLALTGCSGGGSALGDSQEVGVASSNVRADMTISSVDTMPMSEAAGIEVEGYENGTLFLVHASLQLTDGDLNEVDTATFNHRHWKAEGSKKVEVVDPGFFQKPTVEGCELFSSETVTSLVAGKVADFCQIFVSAETGAKIESVTFKKSGMKKKPSWTWEVKG